MSKIKNNSLNLSQINNELITFCYEGYDLYFVHGWFCSYLSAPSDSQEDLVLPTYLVLNEDKINDEHKFSKLVDKLMEIYTSLADSIFEKNKLIHPIVDLNDNSFTPDNLSIEQKQNLIKWLYGYLTGYLVLNGEVTDYINDESLLDDKFYPALFTLCVALIKLVAETSEIAMEAKTREDFAELMADIKAMWESEEGEELTDNLFNEAMAALDYNDIITALNDLFYVMRVSDEKRMQALNHQNSLLGKLTTRH